MNPILEEWLSPQSLAYLTECLQVCQGSEMLADLRAIAPTEALRQASQRLSSAKRQQIKIWVCELNSAREVAA